MAGGGEGGGVRLQVLGKGSKGQQGPVGRGGGGGGGGIV